MKSNWVRRPLWIFIILCALPVAASPPGPLASAKREPKTSAVEEDFFVISSVDAKKNQIVLKHPTEVTELVRVTDETVYLDASGKRLPFQDLRAGDTVYVTSKPSADGTVALRIRKGPMTVEELHRRYLRQ